MWYCMECWKWGYKKQTKEYETLCKDCRNA